MKGSRKVSALSFLLIIIALLSCERHADIAGNGSNEGNAKGRMVRVDGAPVAGAIVRFFSVDHIPTTGIAKLLSTGDSAITDAEGNFATTLDTGTYNMFGDGDSIFCYKDSIAVTLSPIEIMDTLRAAGGIKGVCHMPGQDSISQARVTIYSPGSALFTKPGIGGNFTLSNIAQGTYTFIFDPTLDQYRPKVVTVQVVAGQVTNLDTVILYSSSVTGLPTAAAGQDRAVDPGTTVHLHGMAGDTLGGIAKMEWDIGSSGSFIETRTGDTTILAPTKAGEEYVCIFRATDSDGNVATDTINILTVTFVRNSSISGEVTWKRAESPYYVGQSVYIGSSGVLRIEPGVSVKFGDSASIRVAGTLAAVGNAVERITFKRIAEDTSGKWGGIYFDTLSKKWDGASGCILSYCVIENCSRGMAGWPAPLITNCTFRNISIVIDASNANQQAASSLEIWDTRIEGSNDAIVTAGIIDLTMRRDTVENTAANALNIGDVSSKLVVDSCVFDTYQSLKVYGSPSVVTNSTFKNAENGLTVWLEDSEVVSISRCSIIDNQTGILVFGYPGNSSLKIGRNNINGNGIGLNFSFVEATSTLLVDSNNIEGASSFNIKMGPVVASSVNARFNYWGTTDSSQIADKILDANDIATSGRVNYEPFLMSKMEEANGN